MMPRPMTPTASRLLLLFFRGELAACLAEARLVLCRERRACLAVARLRCLASGGGPGVEVAIVFLEQNRRIEQIADPRRRQDFFLRTGSGNAAVVDQNDSLNLGNDFLDVMRDQDDCGPAARHLP